MSYMRGGSKPHILVMVIMCPRACAPCGCTYLLDKVCENGCTRMWHMQVHLFWTLSHVTLSIFFDSIIYHIVNKSKNGCTRMWRMQVHLFLDIVPCHIVNIFLTVSHITLSISQKMCASACATCGCTHFRTLYPKSRCTRMGHMRVHHFLRTVTCHTVNVFGQCPVSHCQRVKKCVPLHVLHAGAPIFAHFIQKVGAPAWGTCGCTLFAFFLNGQNGNQS
jgi:hypothetical protein